MADAKRVLFRKGTTAEHKTFAGARAEITVDIDRNIAIVHDGSTQGGHELVGVAATGQSIVNKNSIGIGTSNATSELTVFGSSLITGISTFNSDVIFNGNIGVGTTNPTAKFDVVGDVNITGVVTANAFNGNFSVTQTSTNESFYPLLVSSIVSGNRQLFVDDGQISYNPFTNKLELFNLGVNGELNLVDNVELNFGTSKDAWFNYNGTGNYLELQLGSAATDFRITDNGTERFRFVKSTGNIGIGSTQPTSKFIVEGDARISGITTTETLSVGIITGIGNSTISVSTSIIPTSNIEYDLGSPTNRFRDLYLSGNTINLGEATLSASGSSIELTSQGTFGVPSLSVSGISSFFGIIDADNINATGVITALTFNGNLSGTATNSENIGISTTSSTNPAASIVLVGNRDVGNQSPFIDAGLLYDADANNLYSTSFTGNLFGNASSASIATTATNVNITASNTLGSFCNVVFVNASSGGSGVLVDSANLYYVPSTDTLYSANFRGNLTGTATTATTLGGVSSGSFLRSDAADQKTSGTLRFNDNVILSLGTGDDAEFFCNGTHFYLDLNSGIGNFYIRDGTTTRFTFDDAGHFTATGNISDSKGNLRSAPVNNRTSAYTLVAADAGKMITTNSGVTVPASVFSAGDMITIINSGTSSITITQGASTTVYLAVAGNTGNRTLAAKGICTLLCYASNTFLISGAGVN